MLLPMKLLAVDKTAMDYWSANAGCAWNAQRLRPFCAPVRPPDPEKATHLCRSFSAPPFHVLISEARGLRRAGTLQCHRHAGFLPSGSFIRVEADLWVATPEYLFLRAAAHLELLHLIAFGYRLCGTYFPAGNLSGRSLSSTAKLSRYLERCTGVRGVKKARRAMAHVLDNAASPREAAVAMKLTLPCRMGGYGLPHPVLNQRVELRAWQRSSLNKGYLRVDMGWPEWGVAVEYDSDQWHSGRSQITRDSRRRTELSCLSLDVLTVTNDEMQSVADMDRLVRALAPKLGSRVRTTVKDYDALKVELRDMLEGWR